jgi:glycine oxidase
LGPKPWADEIVKTFDVVIVGGGLIGASIAFELAPELRVAVLDRQRPGQEASWAAAGMLSPAPESARDSALVPLGIASVALYPEFIAAIEEASGQSTGYARRGALEILLPPWDTAERDARVARYKELGIAAEVAPAPLDGRNVHGGNRAAIWLPEEASVEPRALTEAVLAAAVARGAEILPNRLVTAVWQEYGRCAGVMADDEKFAAHHVVMAAGCFSASVLSGDERLAGMVPTRPVRGQMISFHENRRSGSSLETVLRSDRGYLVPRRNGQIVAGSTSEEVGFEKQVTLDGIRKITAAAIELLPSLAEAEITETWCGLRPGTPDDLPILGPTDMPGLVMATGHYRNGILLAPITAKLVKEWIVGKRGISIEVGAFSPMRFASAKLRGRGASGTASCD